MLLFPNNINDDHNYVADKRILPAFSWKNRIVGPAKPTGLVLSLKKYLKIPDIYCEHA